MKMSDLHILLNDFTVTWLLNFHVNLTVILKKVSSKMFLVDISLLP